MEEDTTLCSEKIFLRSYLFPMLDNKRKDVLCPRVTHCGAKKIKYFSHPLFGVYLIFLSFFSILKILKKNKIMLHYKGWTSVTKHTSSKHKEHTNSHSKETCAGKGHLGKIPPWVKVLGCRGKVIQGLRIRHPSKVLLRETWTRH